MDTDPQKWTYPLVSVFKFLATSSLNLNSMIHFSHENWQSSCVRRHVHTHTNTHTHQHTHTPIANSSIMVKGHILCFSFLFLHEFFPLENTPGPRRLTNMICFHLRKLESTYFLKYLFGYWNPNGKTILVTILKCVNYINCIFRLYY